MIPKYQPFVIFFQPCWEAIVDSAAPMRATCTVDKKGDSYMQTTRRTFVRDAAMGAVGLAGACALASAGATTARADEAKDGQSAEGASGQEAQGQVYTASHRGIHGDVTVTLTVKDGKIADLTAEGPFESPEIGAYALELLPPKIVEANSIDVDVLAGATVTSTAIIKATAMAMVQAGLDAKCAPAAQTYTPGTYSAAYVGKDTSTTVPVEVTFSKNAITGIVIGDCDDYAHLVQGVRDNLVPDVIEQQSLAVDGVTTATYTSRAVLKGIADCVEQAGGEPASLRHPLVDNPVKADDEEMDADVVIVGGGTAGSVALCRLAEAGLSAVCLESAPVVGGMGNIAGFTPMRWYGSQVQKDAFNLDDAAVAKQVEDDVEFLYGQAHQSVDKRLLRNIATACGPMADMLQAAGMEVTADSETTVMITQEGKRWQPMHEHAAELGAKTLLEHRVDKVLIDENGTACGVVAERNDGSHLTVHAKAVLLAAGGAGANKQMMLQYYPDYSETAENCAIETIDGAVLTAAWEAGAKKGAFGVHAHTHTLPRSAELEGNWCFDYDNSMTTLGNLPLLWLDREGRRFGKETECYNPTPGGNIIYFAQRAFNVLDQATVDSLIANGVAYDAWFGIEAGAPLADLADKLEGGETAGYVFKADTIEELAEKCGWNAQVAADEIARYNAAVEAKSDPDYGREPETLVYKVETGPFYALELHPRILGSFGGIMTDSNYDVLGGDGKPMAGLYAAGDLAAGWFGTRYMDIDGLTSFHNTTSGYVAAGSIIDYLA